MIWKLKQLQSNDLSTACIYNKWVPARPLNYKCRSIKQKIKECYYLWVGKTESFTWPENQ